MRWEKVAIIKGHTNTADFLRLSRATVDDSLSLHLNALLTPSKTPFAYTSTSTSARPAMTSFNRRQIPGSACRAFRNQILLPSWQSRDEIFSYCNSIADTPEDLPEASQLPAPAPFGSSISGAPSGQKDDASPSSSTARHSRNYWGQDQVVDERTDPYSARDYSYTREGKAQVLKDVLANEQGVERIVRSRTWSLLGERCLDEGGQGVGTARSGGWEDALKGWKEDKQ